MASLGKLSASVVHEINNPINGIINYAQLLSKKSEEGSFSKNVLQSIVREGNRVAELVSNLLGFAHKDTKKKQFVALKSLIAEPINLLSRFFKNEGIHLDIGIGDDLPEVYCNERQIEQVILNLLSNARYALNEKYPKEGNNKFIIIDSLPQEKDDQLQLYIQDMGTGIDQVNLQKILAPLFINQQAGIGTGIGLSISKNILLINNGDIYIESKFGEYTKVILTLSTTKPE
mgnify:CR=1 FL=1